MLLLFRSLVFLCLPLLAGCVDENQKSQMASCYRTAQQAFPGQLLQSSSDMGSSIRICMFSAGYEWNMYRDECQASFTSDANPYCYRPMNPDLSERIEEWWHDMTVNSRHR
jgi:hypothetical protein